MLQKLLISYIILRSKIAKKPQKDLSDGPISTRKTTEDDHGARGKARVKACRADDNKHARHHVL